MNYYVPEIGNIEEFVGKKILKKDMNSFSKEQQYFLNEAFKENNEIVLQSKTIVLKNTVLFLYGPVNNLIAVPENIDLVEDSEWLEISKMRFDLKFNIGEI